jgi:toxin CptA
VTATTVVSLLLIFLIGMAIQRGNTCTVVAFDDIVHRRSWDRLLAIVYSWFWVAGGLALLALASGFRAHASVVPVTAWSVVGGLVLGLGAVINGGCTTGTIARIGSGEYAFGLTVVGFFIGCLLAPHVVGRLATTHTSSPAATTSLDHPLFGLIGLAVVTVLTARRLIAGPHESFRDFLRNAWDPRTATLIIAVLFVTLVQIDGPWAYTDLLGDISKGTTDHLVSRLVFFAALLAGAITAGRSLKGTKLIGPLAPRVIRCSVGGLIMGIGFSVAPGAFDGLTLLGQPLLLPFAWIVMAASYVSILLGVLYLRSSLGDRIKSRRG